MDGKLRKTVVGASVAAVGLISAVTLIGWKEIFGALISSSPRYMALGFVVSLGTWLAWSISWITVVHHVGHSFSFAKHLMVFFGGLFANNITPMGRMGGEPFIAWVLCKNSDVSYEKSLAAVFSADLINTLPFFSISVIGLLMFVILYPTTFLVKFLGTLLAVVGIAITAALVTAWIRKDFAEEMAVFISSIVKEALSRLGLLTKKLEERLNKEMIQEKVDSFYYTVHSVVSTRKRLFKAVIMSHLAWFLEIVVLYIFLIAAGWVEPRFTYILLILPISNIASYFPSPGGIGGFEAVLVLLLVFIAGIPVSTASVAVILYRTAAYILPTIVGGFCVFELSTGASGIKKIFEEE
ncbi:MAG: lysylphosphatidylglycerol synthase transmembrane domain-containing protein [Candidatus Nanohaloarchaea archaeon]|nr:lysylphosphatidylglycerol synthase transmembrane domain-containing protein [Candidatus Nanohaloarchaea archaeon]